MCIRDRASTASSVSASEPWDAQRGRSRRARAVEDGAGSSAWGFSVTTSYAVVVTTTTLEVCAMPSLQRLFEASVRSGCAAQANFEDGTARTRRDIDRAAVRLDDGRHDREAEACGLAGLAHPRDIGTYEPFEYLRQQRWGDAGPVVGNLHHRVHPVDRQTRGHVRAGGSVRTGVGEQVRDDLVDAEPICSDEDRLLGHLDVPLVVRAVDLGVGSGIGEKVRELDLAELERWVVVQAGQQEQILD